MSRTDKDTPYWVTAEWWEPQHWRCEIAARARWWPQDRTVRECDLPDEPVVQYMPWHRHPGRCAWAAVHPRQAWHRVFPHVPDWFVNHVWSAPQRQASRIQCREAMKEWRGSGDTDVVVTVDQARHGARWLWA